VTAPSEFDGATAVGSVAGFSGAPGGSYDATLSSTWAIGDRPHGGYLLSVMGRAGAAAVAATGADHPHVLSSSALFLRAPSFGAARVDVEVLRAGRSVSQLQVTLVQDGQPCVRALQAFGTIGAGSAPRFLDEEPPALPPWEESTPRPRAFEAPAGAGPGVRVGIAEVTDTRMDPATLAAIFGGGTTAANGTAAHAVSRAEVAAWVAFADGRPADPLSLLFTVDALPPVVFALGYTGWVPTIELTAYIRALPAPGPLQVRHRGRLVQDGRFDEVCDVWDSSGRLVAQATQLAGYREPA
jgi:acyl-coenzyme A thioesterase PaaI-like protein